MFFQTVFYPDDRTKLGVDGLEDLGVVFAHEFHESLVHAEHHALVDFICGEEAVPFSRLMIAAPESRPSPSDSTASPDSGMICQLSVGTK